MRPEAPEAAGTDRSGAGASVRRGSLRLQVTALGLAALLPVAWLIGRRTAPAARPLPVLVPAAEPAVLLTEAPHGLAGGSPPVTLPPVKGPEGAYRLEFALANGGAGAPAPYRVRVERPDGSEIWQAIWNGAPPGDGRVLLTLPAALLRPGRHRVVVEDATGRARSFPFLVPPQGRAG
jgi:hypothetical protein